MSKIVDDFKLFRDKHGMVGLVSDDGMGVPTQNGQLFTMEYLICLRNSEWAIMEDRVEETIRINEVFKTLEVIPGTTLRHSESTEGNSMDNNIAHLTFDALYGRTGYAKRAQEAGLSVEFQGVDWEQGAVGNAVQFAIAWLMSGFKPPKNYWHNTKPGWFAGWGWYGRSPGYMGYLDICATGKTTWFRELSLWVGQFLGCFADKGNTDARKLPYIVWQLLKTRGPIWSLSYKFWGFILKLQYPRGMKDVYSLYYRPEHPINKYSQII